MLRHYFVNPVYDREGKKSHSFIFNYKIVRKLLKFPRKILKIHNNIMLVHSHVRNGFLFIYFVFNLAISENLKLHFNFVLYDRSARTIVFFDVIAILTENNEETAGKLYGDIFYSEIVSIA